MLSWASRFDICCFLDDHDYALPLHRFECLLATGAAAHINAKAGQAFDDLKKFAADHKDWLFGHFSYDLVAETEQAGPPAVANPIGFPDLFFFVPETVIQLKEGSIRIGCLSTDPAAVFTDITRATIESPPKTAAVPLQPVISRQEYLDTVRALQQHILRGDCYEINFCQEFFACPAPIDPLHTWFSLSKASPNPFSAFYRLGDSYLLCASPERYLQRTGNTLFSQPIKGTSPRFPGDPRADDLSGDDLYNSPKDRAENVMVVDLVRNDLSKICLPGSVKVEELFGIYHFPQVHQMISTISGEVPPALDVADIVRATFPMGSMTGAPKKRVVELIRRYERAPRGLFSVAVGYITPEGDFDFNVVIRSLFYEAKTQYLSYQVGSGITFYSDPEAEYEECLVKAEGIRKALALI